MLARRIFVALIAASAACCATAARADIVPPPGALERAFADMIIDAGFKCGGEASFVTTDPAAEEQYARQGLRARVVVCGDGHKYLVATPTGHRGAPVPNEPQPPQPIIKPLP